MFLSIKYAKTRNCHLFKKIAGPLVHSKFPLPFFSIQGQALFCDITGKFLASNKIEFFASCRKQATL